MSSTSQQQQVTTITSILEAEEHYLKIDDINDVEIKVWYRVWGNPAGIPVLFVHGGPGNCVAHYKDINADFFDRNDYYVVEVDQRGTGKSTPSVQDLTPVEDEVLGTINAGVRNMVYYRDISIQQMGADFEHVRKALGIENWLVFGGSWGSTLGLDYAVRYPKVCLGLIVRGIFLSIEEEMDDVFTGTAIRALATKLDDGRYQREFDVFFEVADREFRRCRASLGEGEGGAVMEFAGRPFQGTTAPNNNAATSTQLSPDDARGILQVYEHLIQKGNREAIWKFFVFECNLMEEDPSALLDPNKIDEADFAEAQSVSFFEARLFLRGVYESTKEEFDLLESVPRLTSGAGVPPEEHYRVPTWVVQGTGDVVCPDKYAEKLVERLESAGVLENSYFVDAGHKASSTGIHDKLVDVVKEFYESYKGKE